MYGMYLTHFNYPFVDSFPCFQPPSSTGIKSSINDETVSKRFGTCCICRIIPRLDWRIISHGETHFDPGNHPRFPLEIRTGGCQSVTANGVRGSLCDEYQRAHICLL